MYVCFCIIFEVENLLQSMKMAEDKVLLVAFVMTVLLVTNILGIGMAGQHGNFGKRSQHRFRKTTFELVCCLSRHWRSVYTNPQHTPFPLLEHVLDIRENNIPKLYYDIKNYKKETFMF